MTEEEAKTDLNLFLCELEAKRLFVSTKKQRRFLSQRMAVAFKLRNDIHLRLLRAVLQALIGSNPYGWIREAYKIPNQRTVKLLLILSWLSFRLFGLAKTISLFQNWRYRVDNSRDFGQQEHIQAIDKVVREIAVQNIILPMTCKERSLVTYHILREFYGLPADLVIGVDQAPFQVHAWVECNNMVLTDDPEHCNLYTPIIRYS